MAYPISLILDRTFGEVIEQPKMSRSELKALMTLQTKLLEENLVRPRDLSMSRGTIPNSDLENAEGLELQQIPLEYSVSYGAIQTEEAADVVVDGDDDDKDDLTSGEVTHICNIFLKFALGLLFDIR